MIERTTIEGKSATVVYLKNDFSPCASADADMVKVLFDDGNQIFGTARKADVEASKNPLTVLRKFVDAYGTSEGVKKAWDTRGRGRHQEAITPQLHGLGKVADVKSPQEIYKAFDQWRAYLHKNVSDDWHDWGEQPTHALGIMRDIASSYENMEKKGDKDGGFLKSEAMRDQKGNIVAALAISAIGKDNVMLDYLAVHPAVLMGKVDVKGIGTHMMVEAAKYAAGEGKGLKLFALEGAEGFYRKCGMKEDGGVYTFDKQQVKQFISKVSK
jgi:hypothetical protein